MAQAGLVWAMIGEPSDEQLTAFVETGNLDGAAQTEFLPYNPAVMESLAKTWKW